MNQQPIVHDANEPNADQQATASDANESNVNDDVITVESSFESSYEEADDTRVDPTYSTRAAVQPTNRPNIRSTHPFSFLNLHVAFMCLVDEPKTFSQAVNCSEKEKWIAAMKEEYNALVENDSWQLVQRPLNRNVNRIIKLIIAG